MFFFVSGFQEELLVKDGWLFERDFFFKRDQVRIWVRLCYDASCYDATYDSNRALSIRQSQHDRYAER